MMAHKRAIAAASAAVAIVGLAVGLFLILRPGPPAARPPLAVRPRLPSPSTGTPVASLGPVIAVKVDNINQARPHTGLSEGVYARADSLASAAGDPARMHAFQVAAALLAASALASASHESAAILHGLPLLDQPPGGLVTVTRPPQLGGSRACGKDLKVHAAALFPGQVMKHYGLPVTSVARTVVDLARTSPFKQGVVVADSALHAGKTTAEELASVLTTCPNWPGAQRARRVVAFSDHRSESVLESCARVTFEDYGLPAPELQVDIGDEGFIGRVDFCWLEYLTIAEADGMVKYADPRRAAAQLERDQLLREAGYKVVHFTWRQLFYETGRVIAWIRDAVGRVGPH